MDFKLINEFFKKPLYENEDFKNNKDNLKITKELYQNTRGINTPKSYIVVSSILLLTLY